MSKIALLFSSVIFATACSLCCQGQARTLSENEAVVLRSERELWSKGDLAVADELYSPKYVCHFVVGPEWKGLKGIKDAVANHRRSFPDWHEKVDDIVAEGNEVVIRFTSTGTQLGEFQGIAPTGRKVQIQEMAIFRLSHGKIIEQWGMPDIHGLLAQLRAPNLAPTRSPGGAQANHR